MEKVGIFGGSFNPIHLGHLIFAQEALNQYDLDKIVFIPAAQPPHKDPAELIEPEHRYRMVQLAIAENPQFDLSDMEILRKGKSFTIDTVEEFLRNSSPGTEPHLLVGMDMLTEIFTWKDAEKLVNLCWFLGGPRQGYTLQMLDERVRAKVKTVTMPIIEIAARTLRKRIVEDRPIRYWVPETVLSYIHSHRLYRISPDLTIQETCDHKT